jgi:primary-amine oxidase
MAHPHFLAPLAPDELRACSAAVKAYFNNEPVRFNTVQTLEPPKRLWVAKSPTPPPRSARAVVSVARHFFELDLLLLPRRNARARVAAVRPIDLSLGQPLATAEDCLLAESVARADPRVAAACARALRACRYGPAGGGEGGGAPSSSPAELMERCVALDPWALHHCPDEWYGVGGGGGAGGAAAQRRQPRRVLAVFAYARPSPRHNEYARPLPVTAAVDLHAREVIAVEEWLWEEEEGEGGGGAAAGQPGLRRRSPPGAASTDEGGEFAPELLGRPPRASPPHPLRTSQPRGPSFRSPPGDPWRVLWQGWDFRVGFNAREGLVLYDVAFAPYGGSGRSDRGGDGASGAALPVAHRISLAEMCVPYSDPRPPYDRRCALDAGDYGLGAAAVPQSACADCAGGGDVRYLSPCLSDAEGEPRVVQNAVCLHEVDAGVLWKHADYRTGSGPLRRATELVAGFAMVAVNYDYLFSFIFGLDGSIRVEARLTGVLSTNRLSRDEASSADGLPTHGTLVAPRVVAGHHQHLFCARLDLAVGDARGGRGLVVSEVDPVRAASGNGFAFRERVLPTRPPRGGGADGAGGADGGRDPAVGRVWRVSDPRRLHPRSRRPRAYELRVASPCALLAAPGSPAARRALFATKALWVTPHEDGALFPTGAYALNARRDTGPMARWWGGGGESDGEGGGGAGGSAGAKGAAAAAAAAEDDDDDDDDPVLWATFGVTHEVRPEDYPVMPRDACGLELRPHNFLDGGNPAVDLPPPAPEEGGGGGGGGGGGEAGAAAPRSKL